jgi:hypothetical protein
MLYSSGFSFGLLTFCWFYYPPILPIPAKTNLEMGFLVNVFEGILRDWHFLDDPFCAYLIPR